MILSPLTAAMVLVCGAVYTDLLWRKIPNWLTMPFILLGFWLNGVQLGAGPGVVFAFKGLVAGLLFLMAPFLLGGAGGGDVKLLGAIGAIVGGYVVYWIFLYGAMAGGVVSLFMLLRKSKMASVAGVFEDLKLLVFHLAPGLADQKKERECIPYSVPIFAGYIAYVLAGGAA
ncbi:MAG: prepilin peptidase [Desulfobacterium sp.]|nr:prepilin peptidase [Desulfobacterium sp.]